MNKNPNREEVLLAWMLGSHFFPHLVVFDDISMVNTLDFFLWTLWLLLFPFYPIVGYLFFLCLFRLDNVLVPTPIERD